MIYHGIPGGIEWLVVMFISCFVYIIPIVFAVFVIVYLVKIHNAVAAILNKLEQQNSKVDSTSPEST